MDYNTIMTKTNLSGTSDTVAALYAHPHLASLRVNIQGIHIEMEPAPSAFSQSHQSGYLILAEQDIITHHHQRFSICFLHLW